jgi:phage host-nuclease inhibitor protein Gam
MVIQNFAIAVSSKIDDPNSRRILVVNPQQTSTMSELVDCVRESELNPKCAVPDKPDPVPNPTPKCAADHYAYYFKCIPNYCKAQIDTLTKSGSTYSIKGSINSALYLTV